MARYTDGSVASREYTLHRVELLHLLDGDLPGFRKAVRLLQRNAVGQTTRLQVPQVELS
jgi:hypothetical protein